MLPTFFSDRSKSPNDDEDVLDINQCLYRSKPSWTPKRNPNCPPGSFCFSFGSQVGSLEKKLRWSGPWCCSLLVPARLSDFRLFLVEYLSVLTVLKKSYPACPENRVKVNSERVVKLFSSEPSWAPKTQPNDALWRPLVKFLVFNSAFGRHRH